MHGGVVHRRKEMKAKQYTATFEDDWYISIVRNERLPEDGGIWADYDLDGELEPYSVFAWGD